jgi:plasmid maintenance system antidote protein VapI
MGRTVIYQGELLAEQLEEFRMSAVELSRQLKVITNHITEILNGRCSLTGNTALGYLPAKYLNEEEEDSVIQIRQKATGCGEDNLLE